MTDWQDDPVTAAQYVLYVADGGRSVPQPGGFAEALVNTILRADMMNRARLRLGFPALVDAVNLYQNTEHGHEELRKIARVTK